MDNRNSSRRSGTILASAAAVVAIFAANSAIAQTVATVNGVDIKQTTYDQYLQNRAQKPVAEATPEDHAAVMEELTDIYLLTTLPRAVELAEVDEVKAQIELQYRAILAQAVVTDWLQNNPATEAEIQEAYTAQTLLAPDLQFNARHILVETQSSATDIITQLDGGADFAALAMEHSTGPSGPTGGDLGWFAPNQMVAPFADAVSEMENGNYTKAPVQTDFGWHVIMRVDSRVNEPAPLESVHDDLKQSVEQMKFQTFLEDLRATLEE